MSESRDTSYQGGGSEDGGWRMERAPNITLNKILLVSALALGAFLGCGSGAGRPAEDASNAEPQDFTRAAAAGIDEPSIRTHLDLLTGVSPASLGGRQVTISERGSESGRRTAAE
jgi:hypothetical protein